MIVFLLCKATNGQENGQCSKKVHDYLSDTTRKIYEEEFLPDLKDKMIEKDTQMARQIRDQVAQFMNRIGSLETENSELKEQVQEMQAKMTEKVLFQAKKTNGGKAFSGAIKFNVIGPNIGGGMNGPRGEFKAPLGGLYRFTFSAMSGYEEYGKSTHVVVRKNGSQVFIIADINEDSWSHGNNMAYIWILELFAGDTLTLEVQEYLYGASQTPITFTGELISNQV